MEWVSFLTGMYIWVYVDTGPVAWIYWTLALLMV